MPVADPMMARQQTGVHAGSRRRCRCPTILCLQTRGSLGSHGEIWELQESLNDSNNSNKFEYLNIQLRIFEILL
jgi:hypothetical protein